MRTLNFLRPVMVAGIAAAMLAAGRPVRARIESTAVGATRKGTIRGSTDRKS